MTEALTFYRLLAGGHPQILEAAGCASAHMGSPNMAARFIKPIGEFLVQLAKREFCMT